MRFPYVCELEAHLLLPSLLFLSILFIEIHGITGFPLYRIDQKSLSILFIEIPVFFGYNSEICKYLSILFIEIRLERIELKTQGWLDNYNDFLFSLLRFMLMSFRLNSLSGGNLSILFIEILSSLTLTSSLCSMSDFLFSLLRFCAQLSAWLGRGTSPSFYSLY